MAFKNYGLNYPKMGLIKLLLLLALKLLIYLQERLKHGLDRHFIHKLVGKCDIIMQNYKLIIGRPGRSIDVHKRAQPFG